MPRRHLLEYLLVQNQQLKQEVSTLRWCSNCWLWISKYQVESFSVSPLLFLGYCLNFVKVYWILSRYPKVIQKQPPRGVPKKRCSENMQQIYRRTPMQKCDLQLRHGCSPVNLLHVFRTLFTKNTSGGLLLAILNSISEWLLLSLQTWEKIWSKFGTISTDQSCECIFMANWKFY